MAFFPVTGNFASDATSFSPTISGSATRNAIFRQFYRDSSDDLWIRGLRVGVGRVDNTGTRPTYRAALYRRASGTPGADWSLFYESGDVSPTTDELTITFNNPVVFKANWDWGVAIWRTGGTALQLLPSNSGSSAYASGTPWQRFTIAGAGFPNTMVSEENVTNDPRFPYLSVYYTEENAAPKITSTTVPATSSSATPTMSFVGSDTNDDMGDTVNTVFYEFVNQSGGATYSDFVNVGLSPNVTTTGAWAGSVTVKQPIPNGTYNVRLRLADQAGTLSGWSTAQTMVINAQGVLSTVTPAAGARTNSVAWPSITYTWAHSGGLGMTAYRFRFGNRASSAGTFANGYDQTGDITASVANNGTLTVTQAAVDAAAASGAVWLGSAGRHLEWNSTQDIQVQGKDSAGNWSQWSAVRSFLTDHAPAVPTILAPTSSQQLTNRNTPVRVTVGETNVSDSVSVALRIKDSTGAVLFTRAMTYVSTAILNGAAIHTFTYTLTATDVPSPGAGVSVGYRLDASAFDGTLYSGTTTDPASRAWSQETPFTYTQGPDVAITTPASGSTLVSSLLNVTHTVTGTQQQVRYLVIDTTNNLTLYDQTFVDALTTRSIDLSASLRNNVTLSVSVTARVSNVDGNVTQTNPVAYTPARSLGNLVASPESYGFDIEPSGVLLTWDQSDYAPSVWQNVSIYAVPVGAADNDARRRNIATVSDIGQHTYRDYTPPSNVDWEYRLSQTVRDGINYLSSTPTVVQTRVDLPGMVLSAANNPQRRVSLHYADKRSGKIVRQSMSKVPLGGKVPRRMRSPVRYKTFSGTFQLIETDLFDTETYKAAVEDLLDQILCIRDETGAKDYYTVDDDSYSWELGLNGRYSISLSFTQAEFYEGVS